MNLYLTAVVIRRFLVIPIAIAAVFFGRQVLVHEQVASVNHSIDSAQKSFEKSQASVPKKIEVDQHGSKVTVKGLPTAGN
jgi:UDP-N-acetylglucosamine:LPS N-acetylglucosamine transferase